MILVSDYQCNLQGLRKFLIGVQLHLGLGHYLDINKSSLGLATAQ